jgi:acyl-CoA synthetase (AMP-forming)/AMP-acid ligase II
MTTEERVPESVRTLPEAIAWWARRTPDALALEAPGWEPVTYARLWEAIGRLRAQLHAAGIGRGTRVALCLPNGLPLTLLSLAAIATATVAPLDAELPEPERERLLGQLRIDALITSSRRSAPARPGSGGFRTLTVHGTGGPRVADVRVAGEPGPGPVDRSWPRSDDIAYLFHTSGTTGEPRPVAHTHDAYMAWAHATVRDFALSPRDRTVGLASLAYAAGEVPLRHALVAGSAFVPVDRSALGSLLERLDASAPTWLYLPAGIVRRLDEALQREPGRRLPPSLRFVRFTSAAIPAETLARMECRFGAPIYPEYSSNEAGVIARVLPPSAARRHGSVGVPFLEVRIVDGAARELPAGAEGEIVVRGPTVTRGGVAGGLADEAPFLPGGWLRTGDLGLLDRDGFLFVTGRKTEIINRGGSKVAPAEIDEALLAHPAVAEAAAFAVQDPSLGEDVAAAVVLAPGATATPRDLRWWLLERLSPHKVPRCIRLVAALPRTPTGKVWRGELALNWAKTGDARPRPVQQESEGAGSPPGESPGAA